MAVLAAVLPALIAAGSAYASSQSARSSMNSANATNVMLQREQRDWERDMAGSAHQREVRDLIGAGLNPILSATGGAGAATPSMGAAQVGALPPVDYGGSAGSTAYSQGLQRQLLDEQIKGAHEDYLTKAEVTERTASENAMFQSKMKWLQGDDTQATDRQKALWQAELESATGTAKGIELENRNRAKTGDVLTGQVRQLLQQYNIGQSAEAKAQIEKELTEKGGLPLGVLEKLLQLGGKAAGAVVPWRR